MIAKKDNAFSIYTKSLSIILSFCLLFVSLPVSALAIKDLGEISSYVEEPTMRDEYTKTYKNSDGTYSSVRYPEQIHCIDADGTFSDINNTLAYDIFSNKYTNSKNPSFDIGLSPFAKNSEFASIKDKDGRELSWTVLADGEAASSERIEVITEENEPDESGYPFPKNAFSQAIYENAFGKESDVDLRYSVSQNRIEEDVIFNGKTFICTVTVRYFAPGFTAVLNEDNSVSFITVDGLAAFFVSSPVMYDAVYASTDNIVVSLEEKDGYIYVSYSLDREWMDDGSRVYPVVLDPSVTNSDYTNTLTDTYTKSGSTSNYSSSGSIYVGNNSGTKYHGFFRYSAYPDISSLAGSDNYEIISATLKLSYVSGTTTMEETGIYPVTSTWTASSVRYSSEPSRGELLDKGKYGDPNVIYSSGNFKSITLDITENVAQCIYNTGTPNYGFTVRYTDETKNDYNVFASISHSSTVRRPVLTVNYSLVDDVLRTSNSYKIKNVGSGKYLEVKDGTNNNGINVYQTSGTDSVAQRFILRDGSIGGTVRFQAECSTLVGKPRYLDVLVTNTNNIPQSGNNVQIWKGGYPNAQNWIIDEVSDGIYVIRLNYNSNLVLTSCGNSDWTSGTSSSSAGNVYISTYSASNANQRWKLENCGSFDKSDSYYSEVYDEYITEDDLSVFCGGFVGNVSLYSGRLTGQYCPDVSISAEYPIGLCFYFNSGFLSEDYFEYIGLNSARSGVPFAYAHGCAKISYYEFIIPEYNAGNVIAYRYVANDGSSYFFKNGEDGFVNEAFGELTVSGTGFSFEADETVRTFDTDGFIVSLEHDGTTYAYNYTDGRLTSVTTGNAAVVSIGANSITLYNGNDSETISYSSSSDLFSCGLDFSFERISAGTLEITGGDERVTLSLSGGETITDISKSRKNGTNYISVPSERFGITYSGNTTELKAAGVDGAMNTADDPVSDYVFDFANRKTTVISYADSGKSKIANTVIFIGGDKDNSVTVDNGSNENLWKNGAVSSSNVSSTTAIHKYSGSSLQFNGCGYYRKSITVPQSGTYTVSAYIKLDGVTSMTGGLRLVTDMNGEQNPFCSEYFTGSTSEDVGGGWQRIFYTFENVSAGTHYVEFRTVTGGTAYVCCVQVENGTYPTAYNVAENLGTYTAKGKYTGKNDVYLCTLALNGINADGLMLSAKQISHLDSPVLCSGTDSDGNPFDGSYSKIKAVFVYENAAGGVHEEEAYLSFGLNGEFFDAVPVKLIKEYTLYNIFFYAETNRFAGDVTVSDISVRETLLHSDGSSSSDSDDSITVTTSDPTETAIGGNTQTVTVTVWSKESRDTKRLTETELKDADGNTLYYEEHYIEYSSSNTVSKEYGTITEYTYAGGSLTSEAVRQVVYSNGNIISEIDTVTEYSTSGGNDTVTVTDESGNVTVTVYDENGNILSVSYPTGLAQVFYTYENAKLTEVTQNGISNSLSYVGDNLSSVVHSDGSDTETYSFIYDTKGNLTSVKVGNRTLVSYSYTNGGYLSGVTYANGHTESYSYDVFGNLISYSEDNVVISEYSYDGCGRLYAEADSLSGENIRYEYDAGGNLIRKTFVRDGEVVLVTEYTGSGSRYRTKIETVDSKEETGKTYDAFGRLTYEYRDTPSANIIKEYVYLNLPNGKTTNTVATERFSDRSDRYSYSYTCDTNGRLTEIRKDGILLQKYYYDLLGQLIREDNAADNRTYVWEYDGNGNITAKKEYAFTTADTPDTVLSTVTYGYSDSNWKDLLTSYNGVTISSDLSGNPLNWRNASSMTWSGRKLTGLTLTDNTAVTYSYNSDGIRTEKTAGTRRTEYLLDGTKVLKQITTDISDNNYCEQILFYYDVNEELVGFHYDLHDYWYGKDINGVIRYIYNENGEMCAEYVYDAWGRVISSSNLNGGTVANINPFRYKDYYFDTETGFYYISARYYDSNVGRWISPDSNVYEGEFDSGAGLLAYNVYAYCANNPVMLMDQSGESITLTCIIIGAGIGLIVGAVGGSHYAKNKKNLTIKDGWDYWKYVIYGGVGGGALGGLAGWAFAGSNAAASISWAYYKATNVIGTTTYAIGRAFEKWFYKAYNVIERQVCCGKFRFNAIYNNSIVELKNYNWNLYSSYSSIIRSFINQANNYMQYVGHIVKGKYGSYLINGVTFCFSSKPPQQIIDALHNIGVTVNWLP